METHTTVVDADGMIHIQTDEALPGEQVTVTVLVRRDPKAVPGRTSPTFRQMSPDERDEWLASFIERTRSIADRLPEDQRTSNHDWLYDENGLPT